MRRASRTRISSCAAGRVCPGLNFGKNIRRSGKKTRSFAPTQTSQKYGVSMGHSSTQSIPLAPYHSRQLIQIAGAACTLHGRGWRRRPRRDVVIEELVHAFLSGIALGKGAKAEARFDQL